MERARGYRSQLSHGAANRHQRRQQQRRQPVNAAIYLQQDRRAIDLALRRLAADAPHRHHLLLPRHPDGSDLRQPESPLHLALNTHKANQHRRQCHRSDSNAHIKSPSLRTRITRCRDTGGSLCGLSLIGDCLVHPSCVAIRRTDPWAARAPRILSGCSTTRRKTACLRSWRHFVLKAREMHTMATKETATQVRSKAATAESTQEKYTAVDYDRRPPRRRSRASSSNTLKETARVRNL